MKRVYIDLDGTLADDRHRKHLAFEKRWAEYFADDAILADPVWDEGYVLMTDLMTHADKPQLVYLTGRRIDTMPATIEWLQKNGFPVLPLIMKPLDEISFTPQWKAEELARAIEKLGAGNVTLYDDDPAVIARVQKICGEEAATHCTWNPPWDQVSA